MNHLIKPISKSITESTLRSNETKSRQELEQGTGKNLGEQEYQDITSAVQNMLTVHGTSLKDIENPVIGPQHEGLTRMLSWKNKSSKHFYNWLRAKINTGNLTKDSEKQINYILGRMQSINFFNGIYKNNSKIKCNPKLKFQEQMIGKHRQALN